MVYYKFVWMEYVSGISTKSVYQKIHKDMGKLLFGKYFDM